MRSIGLGKTHGMVLGVLFDRVFSGGWIIFDPKRVSACLQSIVISVVDLMNFNDI